MRMTRKYFYLLTFICVMIPALTTGCSSDAVSEITDTIATAYSIDTGDSSNTNSSSTAETPITVIETISYIPELSGTAISESASMYIDYSNCNDGYVMVQYLGSHTEKIKFQITGPDNITYNFDLVANDDFQTFPLNGGSGTYTLNTYEQDSGTSYYAVDSLTITVDLVSEYSPYLYSNQFVYYTQDSAVVSLSIEAATDIYSEIDLISSIYYMAMDTLDYDTDKANEASSGGLTDFIPDLDDAISTGKGICFDYASLMVAMLRIQELPAKLVIGYAGEVYHAWINVYTEEYGWIDEVITFDGTEWTLMDPTFADNTESKSALNDFIGDGTNYTEKYVY